MNLETIAKKDDLVALKALGKEINPEEFMFFATGNNAVNVTTYMLDNYTFPIEYVTSKVRKLVRENRLEILKIFLRKYSELDLNRLLFEAVEYRHLEIVKYLIEQGAIVTKEVIMEAINVNQLGIVKYMVDVNKFSELEQLIAHARQRATLEILEYLTTMKLNRQIAPVIYYLEILSPEQRYQKLLTLETELLVHMYNIGKFSEICQTQKFWAERAYLNFQFPTTAFVTDLPEFTSLHEKYLYVQTMHHNPNKCLQKAAKDGNEMLIQFLLQKGASEYSEIVEGAILGNHPQIVSKYLSKISNQSSSYFKMILGWAVMKESLEIVKILYPFCKDGISFMIFRDACERGHLEMIKFFLEQDHQSVHEIAKQAALTDALEITEYLMQNFDFSVQELHEFIEVANSQKTTKTGKYLDQILKSKK